MSHRDHAFQVALVVLTAFAVTGAVRLAKLDGVVASAAAALLFGGCSFAVALIARRAEERRARVIASRLRNQDAEIASTLDAPSLDAIHHALIDIGHELRRRARGRAQSEALLAAIVEMTPAALLLVESRGKVLATNEAARALFFGGQEVVGHGLVEFLRLAPSLLNRVLAATDDELVVAEDGDGTTVTRHLVKCHFELGGDDVVLVMVSDLSHEIARREAEVYRRVIRVLAHEVNNSLAPISSLMHSAKHLADGTPRADEEAARRDARLRKMFETVAGRAERLKHFLDGYSELARLPLPQKEAVAWSSFFERIGSLFPGLQFAKPHAEVGWFDRGQIEQVFVNLVKNAEEAGSRREDIEVTVDTSAAGDTRIAVRDRGHGMTNDVMKSALVPLFSTKGRGGGLGLPLCREIVEAHGGTLRLLAREGGGIEVVLRLPPRSRAKVRSVSGLATTAARSER